MENLYLEFEKALGYEFKDKDLLRLAFTHTTYVFEHQKEHYDSNQRLEFIGDAVLDLVVGQRLYELKPHADEGYLSKTRSIIVCEKSLAGVARKLRMGRLLLLGKGEKQFGGDDKDSTLADAVESVIAAVYFDSGFDAAKGVILKNLSDVIDNAVSGKIFLDYKSKLLELAQNKNDRHEIVFKIVDERGPSHMKEFDAVVFADGQVIAKATGKSKKEAEQKCAELGIIEYKKLFGKSN